MTDTWTTTPGDAISAPLTYNGSYTFSHRIEWGKMVYCGQWRHQKSPLRAIPGDREAVLATLAKEHADARVGWYRSLEQAKEGARRHAAGLRCTCGPWERFHATKCPLVVLNKH